MRITQFNATYVGDEDRVLFRFNTSASQEYRLWLTRLMVRELLALGAQAAVAVVARTHPGEHAQAIAEFKQQTQAQATQFTSFVPATQFPLGAEPLLVKRVRFTLEKQTTALQLELQGGKVLTMQLTESMVVQLRLLLEAIGRKAAWGLEQTAPSGDAVASVDGVPAGVGPKVMH